MITKDLEISWKIYHHITTTIWSSITIILHVTDEIKSPLMLFRIISYLKCNLPEQKWTKFKSNLHDPTKNSSQWTSNRRYSVWNELKAKVMKYRKPRTLTLYLWSLNDYTKAIIVIRNIIAFLIQSALFYLVSVWWR